MKPTFAFATCAMLFFYSCKGPANKSPNTKLNLVKSKTVEPKEKPSPPKPLKPVFGYRFVITGNFDGSGKIDTLTEHFFSGITHKETNKFYENADYDQLVDSVYKQKAVLLSLIQQQKY